MAKRSADSEYSTEYRDAVKWCLIIYARRQNKSSVTISQEIESFLQSKYKDGREVTKKGNLIVSEKTIRCLWGDNKTKSSEVLDEKIELIVNWLEDVMPEYIEAFSKEGCAAQAGDFMFRFLYSETTNDKYFKKHTIAAENVQLNTYGILQEDINSKPFNSMLVNFRKVPGTIHLRIFVLVFPPIDLTVYSNNLSGINSHFSDIIEKCRDNPKFVFKAHGLLIPDPAPFTTTTAANSVRLSPRDVLRSPSLPTSYGYCYSGQCISINKQIVFTHLNLQKNRGVPENNYMDDYIGGYHCGYILFCSGPTMEPSALTLTVLNNKTQYLEFFDKTFWNVSS